MLIKQLPLIGLLLARLASCASSATGWQADSYPTERAGNHARGQLDVVVAGNDLIELIGFGPSPTAERILLAEGPAGERALLTFPANSENSCSGERIVPTRDGWWYSRCQSVGGNVTVTFIGNDLTRVDRHWRAPVDRAAPQWVPFAGERPGGVVLTGDPATLELVAQPIGTNSATGARILLRGRESDTALRAWSAVALSNDRYAVVVIEHVEPEIVQIFMCGGDEPRRLELRLPQEIASITAASIDGKIGLFGVFEDEAFTTVCDADTGDCTTPRILKERVALPSPEPQIAGFRGRFVAAWQGGDDRAVRFVEFHEGATYPVMTVGGSDRYYTILSLYTRGDALELLWSDGNDLNKWSTTEPPTGAFLSRLLWKWLHGLVAAHAPAA